MITRRTALMSTLFGAGYVGLRALATGIPAATLLKGRRALADVTGCVDQAKAQYIILSTSGQGDPINGNVPGTYADQGNAGIIHPADAAMAATTLRLSGRQYTAARPWAELPQNVLDRTCFWHMRTNTPVHPKEPEVLKLFGTTTPDEMLPSLLSKQLAPCLGTVQQQPLTLGATSPSEGLSFAGQALPIIPPLALKATLTNPGGPLGNLQALRDQTLAQLDGVYRNKATAAQRAYLDSLVNSQSQVRNIRQDLLDRLDSITNNDIESQMTAALTLIQMNVTPVVVVHIKFGGDNHNDNGLAKETQETISGVAAINSLMSQLASAGLSDQVTFMSLNVFGRTIGAGTANGRQHNENHQVSLSIGKPFKGGVIGAVTRVGNDYGCTSIDSTTGAGGGGGDIAATDTLPSFGKTMLASVGVPNDVIDYAIASGTVVEGALS
jgi:hypothetical protein